MEILGILDKEFLVSKTDKKGQITYANEKFCEVSQYNQNELIGKNHNMVRHPDMPDETFREIWETIKSEKTWNGIIKNKAKDGSSYWVRTIIYPDPDPVDEHKYISIRTDITKEMNQENENRTNAAFFEILHLATIDTSLKDFLEQTLVIILSIPWLSLVDKGGFFLENGKEYLELTTHRNLSESLVKMCSRVDYGQCLCGLAAQKRELIFASCIDERHENRPEGMEPHGHYNVPMIFQNRLLGVLFLYLKHGHKKTNYEVSFLNRLGILLATILVQKKSEEEMTKLMTDLRISSIQTEQQLSRIESLQKMVRQYTPKAVWETAPTAISSHLKELPIEKVKLCLLFCDMKDFTKFSEKSDPETIINTINEFFSLAVPEIRNYEGEIERFIGDAFFAVFESTKNATIAATKIIHKFKEHNLSREKSEKNVLEFRMGIHCGEVIRGNVGGSDRKDYTVIGDAVNIASRLESNCEPGRILISESIHLELGSDIKVSDTFEIELKGKENKFRVCYLMAVKAETQ